MEYILNLCIEYTWFDCYGGLWKERKNIKIIQNHSMIFSVERKTAHFSTTMVVPAPGVCIFYCLGKPIFSRQLIFLLYLPWKTHTLQSYTIAKVVLLKQAHF